ncbi:phytoene desaturase family protein [Kyrpidia tusciae]|uniref:phytoene desaturase family protein n=1 Tax=Kyrpidia tusciae TaxID=33943 RepID=UPI0003099362|nr:hypothetical protein [Kyrpidia tusciae]
MVSKTGTDFSPVVVSNVDPRVTYETLIGLENVNEEERAQVQALQPSMSLFVWNAALSRPYSNPHLLHWNFAAPKTLPQWGLAFSGAGIHSAAALDPSLAPEGQSTVTINLVTRAEASRLKKMTKETYRALKDDIDRLCRDIIREIDEEAANSILFSEVATPKTIARYLNTYEGSIYSIKRKSPDDFPHMKSSIQGLFLVGAGTGYGPGIEAVIITGSEVGEKMDVPVRETAAV